MSAWELPSGRYLSCTSYLNPDAGGQTRAFLLRNSTFLRESGIRPDILSFVPTRDFAARRDILVERELLPAEAVTRNIADHYRDHPWRDPRPTGHGLTDLSRHRLEVTQRPDGSPWRVSYRNPDGPDTLYDYLRPDGSTFLRAPSFRIGSARRWRGNLQAVDSNGEVVGGFATPAHWFRQWIRDLAVADEPTFVFMDARTLVSALAPLGWEGYFLIYLMHNVHLRPPRRWDSRLPALYRRVLQHVGDLDAAVTLTDRQRQDIAERVGHRDNLFVVPNPVRSEPAPAKVTRDPRLVTVVARLEPQKRLEQAIAVFARVLAEVPDARLEVYGSGSQEAALREQVQRLGLDGAVTMRGYDPRAQDVLWRASVLLSTSAYEGYPLTTLESMSRGCPVVSYDVKYGPREQITDGVDGFLVPSEDVATAADRVVRLLRSPELVQQMSAAALATAARHGTDAFLADWAHVLHRVIEQKPKRTRLAAVDLTVRRAEVRRSGPDDDPELRFAVTLRPQSTAGSRTGNGAGSRSGNGAGSRNGHPQRDGPDPLTSARVELAAVDKVTGEVIAIPVSVGRARWGLRVRARCPLSLVSPEPQTRPERVHLRLRLIANNAARTIRIPLSDLVGFSAVDAVPPG